MRPFAAILLIFGVQFLVVSEPFSGMPTLKEFYAGLLGIILLVIYNAIIWERGKDE